MQGEHHIKNSKSGFTLVELLIVMVMVAGIAAISISAWKSASQAGKQVACMGNLRNIGAALQIYAQENGGTYPLTTHSSTLDRAWIYALEEHLGKFDEARICPADPKGKERLAARGTSYILNSMVFVPSVDAFGRPRGKAMNRPADLADPAGTLLAVVCSDHVGASPGNDHTHSSNWNSFSAIRRDVATDRHGQGNRQGTKGGSNYLYADGHVRLIPGATIKELVKSGINPAKPPE